MAVSVPCDASRACREKSSQNGCRNRTPTPRSTTARSKRATRRTGAKRCSRYTRFIPSIHPCTACGTISLKCWTAPSTKWGYELVLQRRKVGRRTEALVKWFGYPSKFNSWIDASALVHSTIKNSRAYGETSFEK